MPRSRIAALSTRLTMSLVVAASVVISAPSGAHAELPPPETTARVSGSTVDLKVATFNTDFAVTGRQWTSEMNTAANLGPDVLFVQEVQWRDRLIRRWARHRHYRLWYGRDDQHQESDVLIRAGGRFAVRGVSYRLGSSAVRRADGETIHARYIQTVRVRDNRSGRRFALSTTHVVPEVMWWPAQARTAGAPDPFEVEPRFGAPTLAAARTDYARIRGQLRSGIDAGYIPIFGGDFNAGAQYESRWSGFMADEFGGFMTSNQNALGRVDTETDERTGERRSIDYVWARTGWPLTFRHQEVRRVASDHRIVVVDLAVAR